MRSVQLLCGIGKPLQRELREQRTRLQLEQFGSCYMTVQCATIVKHVSGFLACTAAAV